MRENGRKISVGHVNSFEALNSSASFFEELLS